MTQFMTLSRVEFREKLDPKFLESHGFPAKIRPVK